MARFPCSLRARPVTWIILGARPAAKGQYKTAVDKTVKKPPAALEALGLKRNVAVLAASVFGIGLAEELWLVFVPKYLAALGASGGVIGLFASTRDLLDGLYQYPGGWLNDRFG